jgi:DNA gyrase/topoisomerase IV subunit A
MSQFLERIRKSFGERYDTVRTNAQTLKDVAEELGKIARVKFEIHQLKIARRRKFTLLGETVFPFLFENRSDELKNHENLHIILDDIKSLGNQIQLAERQLKDLTRNDLAELPGLERDRLQDEIEMLEFQIEKRLKELHEMKKSLQGDE